VERIKEVVENNGTPDQPVTQEKGQAGGPPGGTAQLVFKVSSQSRKVKAILQTLRHWPGIEYVEPHFIVRLEAEPGTAAGTGLNRQGATPLGRLTVAGADIAAYLTWETQSI